MTQRNLLLSLLCTAMIATTGCAVLAVLGVASAGAAAYAWLDGDMTHTYQASIRDVREAAVETLKTDFRYTITLVESKQIKAVTPKNDVVTLELEYQDDRRTHVSLRVGSFGDEGLSHQILSQIGSRLGEFDRAGYPDPYN